MKKIEISDLIGKGKQNGYARYNMPDIPQKQPRKIKNPFQTPGIVVYPSHASDKRKAIQNPKNEYRQKEK